MAIEIAIFVAVILGVVAGLLLENMRRRIEPEIAVPRAKLAQLRLTGPGRAPPANPGSRRAADLQLVSDAGFASKPLLSGREADVLVAVESIASEAGLGWRVVPQVRLVDIIASSDAEANAAIGDHRVDMLIVAPNRMPVAVVDYQPLGQLKGDSAVRDAIKREALRRAAIPFFEARANEPLEALREQILRLALPPAKTRPARAAAAKAPAKPPVVKPAARVAVAKMAPAKPAPPAAKAKAPPPKPAVAAAVPAAKPAPKTAAKPGLKPAITSAPQVTAKFTPAKVKAAATTAEAPPAPKSTLKPEPASKPPEPAPKPNAKTTPRPAIKPAPKTAGKTLAKPAAKDPPAEP